MNEDGAARPSYPKYRIFAALALIALATLPPGEGTAKSLGACLICGDRGIADAILNVLLFLPLGLALGRGRGGFPSLVARAGLVSLLVEVAQIPIPGRDPSPADLLFNVLGAAIGIALVRANGKHLFEPTRATLKAFSLASVALLIVGGTAALLEPSFPQRQYWGQWTPHFENMADYPGGVLRVRLDTFRIPDAPSRYSRELRAGLLDGRWLKVEVSGNGLAAEPAPVFNIYDDLEREVLSITAHRTDVSVRFRLRASTLLLDQPNLVFKDALGDVPMPGRWSIQMRRSGGGFCVLIQQKESCPVGFTPGRGWSVLLHSPMPSWLEQLLDTMWLTILFVPAGLFVLQRRSAAWLVLYVLAGFLVVHTATDLLAARVQEFAAIPVGLALGAFLRRLFPAQRVQR